MKKRQEKFCKFTLMRLNRLVLELSGWLWFIWDTIIHCFSNFTQFVILENLSVFDFWHCQEEKAGLITLRINIYQSVRVMELLLYQNGL